jgi:predicted RNase H-like HicB family nuclease
MMKQHTYKILLNKEPEGQYTAIVPALPGCVTFGENIEHAIEMAKEAISLYIEELEVNGDMIPDNNETLEFSLNIPA